MRKFPTRRLILKQWKQCIRKIPYAVGIIIQDTKGKPGEMMQQQIYAALKRRFQVGSYSEIAPERFEEALSYLREMWKQVTAGSVPDQQPLM